MTRPEARTTPRATISAIQFRFLMFPASPRTPRYPSGSTERRGQGELRAPAMKAGAEGLFLPQVRVGRAAHQPGAQHPRDGAGTPERLDPVPGVVARSRAPVASFQRKHAAGEQRVVDPHAGEILGD